ncbi:hypothetical protein QO010_004108 [Caulobacter ginsengisoli]|uniref:Uncharacterized protein n=1 Tax=Caulobacter ginsengisoli TaxID=400775 RepID=A0ABU0IWC8_9CAUL|nr:hypothetical protein [Caulobacter ginsengisoli]MDQ0466315.1 hypothetical protein [Caulobacter ginsengisoli]
MILLALTILAAAALPPPPASAPPVAPPAPASPPPAAAPDPAIAAVSAKVDAMMADYKGKPLLKLVQRLGPVETTRTASDGQVVFWRTRTEPGTKCGLNPASGAFSCSPVWGKECLLAVAVNVPGDVVAWKLTGEVAACELFLKPPPPPA